MTGWLSTPKTEKQYLKERPGMVSRMFPNDDHVRLPGIEEGDPNRKVEVCISTFRGVVGYAIHYWVEIEEEENKAVVDHDDGERLIVSFRGESGTRRRKFSIRFRYEATARKFCRWFVLREFPHHVLRSRYGDGRVEWWDRKSLQTISDRQMRDFEKWAEQAIECQYVDTCPRKGDRDGS